ncbi:RNA polymerase sigma factor [Paenibacillus sp. GCM10023248]|uniref:RNA polymerase sigma factor n=1 Tax=Bacillales TaxID=1385 RepID=UPI002378505B|nr:MULTISPECIES: sigma-70 family RNA polymerase sigma factor [Bacillales]MDD9268516.1 sigma-70 family RNA polymerase sigma factor [Paenibacillus sp. MAHUQ-63]MDR6879410.1 RNA polymerase sigma-70 factor (ECF subfamily) [Bacillus sp. 3255]
MDQELYDLISKASNGDKDAFALLVKRFKSSVYRYAYGMLSDRMEAEDVAQEAFIKAFYSLPKLEHGFAFTSWLTRIVSNLCYDRLNQRKKENTSPQEWVETTARVDLERTDLQMSIQEALDTLSPEHREVIILRDVEGYSYDEIAGIIDIPIGTVKSRINAARLLLRKELKRGTGE